MYPPLRRSMFIPRALCFVVQPADPDGGTGDNPEPVGADNPDPDPDEPEAGEDKSEDKPLGPAGERALARVKDEAKQMRAELKELREQIRGQQTPDERLAALERRADEAELKAERYRIISEHEQLTAEDAKYLKGTVEEMEALAEWRASALVSNKPPVDGERRLPKPDPSQGRGGNTTPTNDYKAGRAAHAERYNKN